ncbi:hypothetical protein Tco_0477300 [Tanacetum coccineum]
MHIPVPEEDPQKINDISGPSLIRAAKKTPKGAALTSVGIPAAYYNLGPPSYECLWLSCYHVVLLPRFNETPPPLKQLLDYKDTTTSRFKDQIRVYNSMFCFTSFGTKIDHSINTGRGPYTFRINGQNYHRMGSLLPAEGVQPSQVIPDGKRMEHSNPLNDFGLRLLSERKTNRQYNAPNVSKVTALIINDFGDGEPSRDIIVNKNNSGPQRISKLHPSYMKLQHPLLFPYGEDGFHEKFLIIEIQVNRKQSVDLYHNLCDAVTRDDTSAAGLGKRIVFPRSFTGGPRNPAEINDIISVELPSPIDDPEGYKVVAEYMLHGPYGADAKYAPCTTDGKCSKHFPKSFLVEIVIDEDIYALYCRRNNKVTAKKGKFMYDNKHVVPRNKYLLLKYQEHINIEWCNRSKAIKYLFKYLNKGPDRATVVIQENVKGGQNGTSEQILEVDEIKNFQNCRFLAPCKAVWRLFSYDIHYSYPTVMQLSYHLPDQNAITMRDSQNLPVLLERKGINITMFTEWFELNKKYTEANEILLNVVRGATSFEKLMIVNKKVYATFKAACFAYGLLNDDKEWTHAIAKASFWALGPQLYDLFVTILLFYEFREEQLRNYCLLEIQELLNRHGKSLREFQDLP